MLYGRTLPYSSLEGVPTSTRPHAVVMWRVLVVALVSSVLATPAHNGGRAAPRNEAALRMWLLLESRLLRKDPSISVPPTATPSPPSFLRGSLPHPHSSTSGQFRGLPRGVSATSRWARMSNRLRREIRGSRWGKSLHHSAPSGRHSHKSALRADCEFVKRRYPGPAATNSINHFNVELSGKGIPIAPNVVNSSGVGAGHGDNQIVNNNNNNDNNNNNNNNNNDIPYEYSRGGIFDDERNIDIVYGNPPRGEETSFLSDPDDQTGSFYTPEPLHYHHQSDESTSTLTTTTVPTKSYDSNRVSSPVDDTNSSPTPTSHLEQEELEGEEEEANHREISLPTSESNSVEAPEKAVADVAAEDESLEVSAPQPSEEMIAAVEQEIVERAAENEAASKNLLLAEDEVKWGRLCTPRIALTRMHRDSVLRCELWAPFGTVITWKRAEQTLREDLSTTHDDGIGVAISASNQYVISSFFLDCASYDEEGQYELVATAPSGRTYKRQFDVIIVEGDRFGNWRDLTGRMCGLLTQERRLVPRIHAWTRIAHASEGSNLTLPCLFDGILMSVTWYFQNQELQEDMVTSHGDLMITNVGPRHQGLFTCALRSWVLPAQYHDRIVTSVVTHAKTEL